jgi:hypothetical protein
MLIHFAKHPSLDNDGIIKGKMVFAILLLTGCMLLTLLGVIVYAKRAIGNIKDDIGETWNTFVTPVEEGSPSQLEKAIDGASHIMAQRLLNTYEAKALATKSHESRAANLLAEDVATDLAGQASPGLGMILEAFPAVRKRLAKNPTALGMILPLAQKMMGGLTKPGSTEFSSRENGNNSVADRIKRGGV